MKRKKQLNTRLKLPLWDGLKKVTDKAEMGRDEVADTAYRIALGDESALTIAKWNILKRVAKEVGLPFNEADLQAISLTA